MQKARAHMVSRIGRTACLAVLVVGLALPFTSGLAGEKLVYDGEAIVEKNAHVRGETSWAALWTSPYWQIEGPAGLYRPVTVASFRLQRTVFGAGEGPVPYVAVNLALHLGIVLLLWGLLRRWLGRPAVALAAAALFAVHPVATAVVPNVAGRADLLAALGVLGALAAWQRGLDRGSRGWAAAGGALWLGALLSKEHAVVFLPAAIACSAIARPRRPDEAWGPWLGRHRLGWLGLLALGLGWFAARTAILGGTVPRVAPAVANPLAFTDTASRVMTAIKVQGLYLRNAVWPFELSADYSFEAIPVVSSPWSPALLASGAAIVAIVLGAAALRRRRPWVAWGVLFYAAAMAPVSNVLFPIGTIMADRLLYLPLVGLVVAGAAAIPTAPAGGWRWPAGLAIGIAVLIGAAYAGQTWTRNPIWRHKVALWRATVRASPESVVARYNLTAALAERYPDHSRLDEGLRHAKRAVAIARRFDGPPPVPAYFNCGLAHIRCAKRASGPEARRRHYRKAAQVLEKGAEALGNAHRRGLLPVPTGARRQALRRYYHQLATAHYHLGHGRRAREAYRMAVKMDPTAHDSWASLGNLELQLGRVSKAIEALREAVDAAPDAAACWYSLGRAQIAAGRLDAALRSFERGARADRGASAPRLERLRAALRNRSIERAREIAADLIQRASREGTDADLRP